MPSVLPFPQTLSAFTVEDKTFRLVGTLATLPDGADAVSTWTVEFVVSDGEGGAVLSVKSATLTDAAVPEWEVVFTEAELRALGCDGTQARRWWAANRIDDGAGLVLGRGPFVVVAESTGA